MSKSLETRIRQVERELALMRRELRAGNQRTAAPMMPRLGRHLAKLDEELTRLGEADATIQVWSGGALVDGPVVTIQDLTLGVGETVPVDTLVWVVWDKTTWTWMGLPPQQENQYANAIGFLISETSGGLMRSHTFTGGGMKAGIEYILGGTTPPLDGNGEITVYDDQDMAPLAIRNCKGWAVRNEHLQTTENPRYQIVGCDQMAEQGRAIVDQTLEGGNGAFTIAIRNFQPDSESPNGAMPIAPYSSFALNPHNRRGDNGSPVLLRWGSAIDGGDPFGVPKQGYIIESVRQTAAYMPANFRVNQSTKAIEVQWLKINVETSESEIANIPWEPMFPSKNC